MRDTPSRGSLSNQVIGDPEKTRIIIVDDEETIRLALTRFLESRGFDVESVASGERALEVLRTGHFAVMICDVRMPGLSGVELLPIIRERDPDLAVMMLTALNDAPTAAETLSLGAMEYLTKPIELGELHLAVQRVVHRRALSMEQRNVERLIHDEVARRSMSVEDERVAVVDRAVEALALLIAFSESRDAYFSGSSARVAALAQAMAEVLELAPASCLALERSARLHDIGRLALRESVLCKPASLTADEFEHVKGHVEIGLEILAPLALHPMVIDFVRDHHEHWDGSGYPRRTAGARISIGGRILCAADAFVALTSRRAFRPALLPDETLSYLAAHSGGLLEPAVYRALSCVVSERRVLGLTQD